MRLFEGLAQARVRREEAMRLYEQKCEEASETEAIHSAAIKDTPEKTEALEKHVKTLSMTAESLATTEADFLKTRLDGQEETQQNLIELSAQLCKTRSTQ